VSDADLLKRVPLHDLGAEQSVLGAILLDNAALSEIGDTVELRDVYIHRHGDIVAAMLRLWADHVEIDAITLAPELRSQGKLEAIGGPVYIAELAAGVPTALHARHYAGIVHELALVRDCGTAASQIAGDSFEARRAAEFLSEAQSRLDQVHARLAGPREPTMAESLATAIVDIREDRRPVRLPTGLAVLDAALEGGFGHGELIVLAGLTGRGKSALAMTAATNGAKAGNGVLYVSLEMPKAQLVERMLYAEARVKLSARQRGFLRKELAQLEQAERRLNRPNLTLHSR
jgi:replicative DNA helicase